MDIAEANDNAFLYFFSVLIIRGVSFDILTFS